MPAASQKCMWSWKRRHAGSLNSSATLVARCTLHAARSTPEQATKLERNPMNVEEEEENERRSNRTGQEPSDSTENSYLF